MARVSSAIAFPWPKAETVTPENNRSVLKALPHGLYGRAQVSPVEIVKSQWRPVGTNQLRPCQETACQVRYDAGDLEESNNVMEVVIQRLHGGRILSDEIEIVKPTDFDAGIA